jgi:hypothetical protein
MPAAQFLKISLQRSDRDCTSSDTFINVCVCSNGTMTISKILTSESAARGATYKTWKESEREDEHINVEDEDFSVASKKTNRRIGTIFVNAATQASGRGLEEIQRDLGSTKVPALALSNRSTSSDFDPFSTATRIARWTVVVSAYYRRFRSVIGFCVATDFIDATFLLIQSRPNRTQIPHVISFRCNRHECILKASREPSDPFVTRAIDGFYQFTRDDSVSLFRGMQFVNPRYDKA